MTRTRTVPTRAVQITAGRTLPLWTLRAGLIVAAAASFLLIPVPFAVVTTGLAVVGALLPTSLLTWASLVVLALTHLAEPLALDGRANAVVLIVHVMHVLGGLSMALPLVGQITLRALIAPARRWLAVQVPAQMLLTLAIVAASAPRSGVVPAGAVAIGSAIAVVVMVVLLRVRMARR